MLTRLRIENLKGFGPSQDLRLAPITLLYGPNSAGKSTIMEAILMLAQTVNEIDVNRVLEPNGAWTRLRDYRTLIHNHEVNLPLRLGLFWSINSGSLSREERPNQNSVEGGAVWSWAFNPESGVVRHTSTDYFLADSRNPVFRLVVDQPYDRDPLWSAVPVPGQRREHKQKSRKIKETNELIDRDDSSESTIDWEKINAVARSVLPNSVEERGLSATTALQEGRHIVSETYWDMQVPIDWVKDKINAPSIEWAKFAKVRVELARKRWKPLIDHLVLWRDQAERDPALARKRLRRFVIESADDHPTWWIDEDHWTDESFDGHVARLKDRIPLWVRYMTEEDLLKQADNWAETLLALRETIWEPEAQISSILWSAKLTGIGDLFREDVPTSLDREWIWDLWFDYIVPAVAQAWYIMLPEHQKKRIIQPHRSGDLPVQWLPPREMIAGINEAIQFFAKNLAFVGPSRLRFGPVVQRSDNVPTTVGKDGEWMVDRLGLNKQLIAAVNRALNDLGVGYRVSVNPVADPDLSSWWKFELRDEKTDILVAQDQVGYGVSQLLPLITEVVSKSHSLVLLEQPELHIHPRLQAAFGSILAEATVGDEPSQFIVETHSENLLLRLRRLVRNGVLLPEAISIAYVQQTAQGSRIIPIRLDTNGNFQDPWPGGFFEEGFDEIFGGNP